MTGISIGCGLSAMLMPPQITGTAASVISATQPVVTSRLYAGQSIRDMTDFSVVTAQSNFASTAGGIVNVDIVFTGDLETEDAAGVEGDTAGFSVVVTDTTGTTQTFTTTLRTLEYKVLVSTTDSNEVNITVNPLALATDGETVDLTISGTDYDGIYSGIPVTNFTAAAPPYMFEGTASVIFDGVLADLEAGDTMTHDLGLWTSSTGDLTLTSQAQRDGTDISGATGLTYDLVVADLGKDYTLEVTADDGVNSAVTNETDAISLPEVTAPPVVFDDLFTLTGAVDIPIVDVARTPDIGDGWDSFIQAGGATTANIKADDGLMYMNSSYSGEVGITAANVSLADVRVEHTFQRSTTSGIKLGIILRGLNSGTTFSSFSGYTVEYDQSVPELRFRHWINGVRGPDAGVPITLPALGVNATLTVDIVGNNLTTYIDGIVVDARHLSTLRSGSDTVNLSAGKVGLIGFRSYGFRNDRFTISDLG